MSDWTSVAAFFITLMYMRVMHYMGKSSGYRTGYLDGYVQGLWAGDALATSDLLKRCKSCERAGGGDAE